MDKKYQLKIGFIVALMFSLSISACGGSGGATPAPGGGGANAAPVATAIAINPAGGAVTAFVTGSTVTLDASGSTDANGDPLTYAWSLTSKPAGSIATLSSATTVKPTIVVDKAGSYVLRLIVNDGTVDSAPSNLTLTVTAPASTGSSSGSIGIFTKNGVTFAVTPGGGGAAKLLSLPNSGTMVGAVTTAITSTLITTSLPIVDGTSVDNAHDVGMAFSYNSSIISIFKLSTATEIATYDSRTVNNMSFSGANSKISGAIMDPARQWVILSTADGYDIVDYSTPTTPVRIRLIESTATAVAPAVGVKMMENFGYDPAIPNGGAPFPALTAGGTSGFGATPIQVVDASTGKVYMPDAATQLIFSPLIVNFSPLLAYIDSAAVDTSYHVALLAEEFSSQQHLLDLNKLTFNGATGTYNLPATGYLALNTAGANSLGTEMTNIAIESNGHYVFAGRGFGGTTMSLAQLKDPAIGLGFVNVTTGFAMPGDIDNLGANVSWSGASDPHGVGAYQTDAAHPTQPNTSLTLWINNAANHVAVIDMAGVLTGATGGGVYNPITTMPKDIAYFAIP